MPNANSTGIIVENKWMTLQYFHRVTLKYRHISILLQKRTGVKVLRYKSSQVCLECSLKDFAQTIKE